METHPTPGDARRVLYVSDPSSIAMKLLPETVTVEDLCRWVDMLADSGVDMFQQDVYNQGFTVYWRSERFQYDQRPQHQRFLSLLAAGVQPLQVLLEHSRRRGMAFYVGLRMNDCHRFPAYADIIEAHPEWQLAWSRGKPCDFRVDKVRDFIFEVVCEVVSRFDVDGVEMTFRDDLYFPISQGRKCAPLMTSLVLRVRDFLDAQSRSSGRKIVLGARVPDTLAEGLEKGLDVKGWITDGLIDYVSPSGVMQSNFNAPYEEFAALTRPNQCLLYPGLHPYTSYARCMAWGQYEPMTAANFRALAQTFYAAGADGVSVYNHFVAYLSRPPFYPQALQVLRELRDPARVARGARHYVFHTLPDAAQTPKFVLERAETASGMFKFRLYERMDRAHAATLLLRGSLTDTDKVTVQLNGTPLPPGPLGSHDARYLNSHPGIRWFSVPIGALAYGENHLRVALAPAESAGGGEVVLDDIEIWVQPE